MACIATCKEQQSGNWAALGASINRGLYPWYHGVVRSHSETRSTYMDLRQQLSTGFLLVEGMHVWNFSSLRNLLKWCRWKGAPVIRLIRVCLGCPLLVELWEDEAVSLSLFFLTYSADVRHWSACFKHTNDSILFPFQSQQPGENLCVGTLFCSRRSSLFVLEQLQSSFGIHEVLQSWLIPQVVCSNI